MRRPATFPSRRRAPADLYTALEKSTLYAVVQLFVTNVDELRALGPSSIKTVKQGGLLWVAYPTGGITPSWTKRDVLGELTGEIGYKPAAFVKTDGNWTALRFKKA